MNEYQIRKDIGLLMARVEALEKKISCDRSNTPTDYGKDDAVILASCNRRKNEINDRFNHTKFGSCSHPSAATADIEAATLLGQLLVEHPGCPGSESGHRTTSGAGITTYLAYAACSPK